MKYDKYSSLVNTPRSGWVKRNLSQKESILDHMYLCWLIGALHLPLELEGDDYTEEQKKEYSKETILNLLLIHDLGEADAGDIIRGNKTPRDKLVEHNSIYSFIQDLKLDHSNTDYFSLWETMENRHKDNINTWIAKEIDIIQGTHRYFAYVTEGNVTWSNREEASAAVDEWFQDITNENITSPIGRIIRSELIINNQRFLKHTKELKELFAIYSEKYNL